MATAGNTVGLHKIEVLTRKIQLMEEQQKERQSREVQQDLIQSQPPHVQIPAEHQAEQPQDQHVQIQGKVRKRTSPVKIKMEE